MKRFLLVLACGLLTSTMAFADGASTKIVGQVDTGVKAKLDPTGPKANPDKAGPKANPDGNRTSAKPDSGQGGNEGATPTTSARLGVARTARRPRG
jgi:hypothetical protein